MKALQKRDARASEKFDTALHSFAQKQYETFLKGLSRYRHSEIERDVAEPKTIWKKGATRILDFGIAGQKSAPIVLIIPSLINRYHVLDLDRQQSFVRDLAKAGFRPLLIDWGVPDSDEMHFGIDDYMTQRIFPALDTAQRLAGGKVHVIGYCMGGLLAAALATHKADAIRSLLFLATPWDFHEGLGQAERVKHMLPQIEPILNRLGELPVDVLQCFFISLQPFLLLDKFLRFANMKTGSAEERRFVLIEDWVNEGVPLAGKVARECLQGWYIENKTALGQWKILGKPVLPQNFAIQSLHVIPQNDKIVPPASAMALARAMQGGDIIQPEFGHISMLVQPAAKASLWPRLFDWLASH